MRKTTISEEQEERICEDLRAGLPVREIAGKHDISGKQLIRIQKKHGLLRKEPKPKPKIEAMSEDEIYRREFKKKWDKATAPFRDMIRIRENSRGVYWWNGQEVTASKGNGMAQKNNQSRWRK